MFHHLKFHRQKLFPTKTRLKILVSSIIFGLLFLIAYPLSTPSAFASPEFSIRQDIVYQFDDNGDGHVTHTVTLKNKLSNIYATQYSLTITGERIQNITATDNHDQPLRIDINQSIRRLTKTTVFLDNPTTGKGKSQTFHVNYLVKDYAKREGQTWRIIIPKIENIENLNDVSLEIKAPSSFGPLAFVSPKSYTYHQTAAYQIIKFSRQALSQSEAMIIFGKMQTFKFTLKYYLENRYAAERRGLIALPPDTSYQKIYLNKISPAPENVKVDPDGNWLASYSIPAHASLEITAQGLAQIAANPAPPPLPLQNANNYLTEQTYWEKNNPQIQKLAQRLKTPKAIYEFVTQTLQYDFKRVRSKNIKRQGAVQALNNPHHAICTEFTDLFIALARAAGIPAREVDGYAYSTSPQLLPLSVTTDILHAWPEYWDHHQQTWIQVDPTWENTSHIDYFNKLDMTHLAFAIHGQNSQVPLPAGAYQKHGNPTKNVFVAFASPPKIISPQKLQLHLHLPKTLSPQQQVTGYLLINNTNPTAVYNQQVKIKGKIITGGVADKKIAVIPPFGKEKIEFTIKNDHLLRGGQSIIVATIKTPNQQEQTVSKTVLLKSILSYHLTFWKIILLTLSLLLLGVLIIKHQKRKVR